MRHVSTSRLESKDRDDETVGKKKEKVKSQKWAKEIEIFEKR